MPLLMKPNNKPLLFLITIEESMKKFCQYLFIKESRLNHKSLQEVLRQQPSKPGFLRMVEQFKLQQAIILDKISLKCLRFNLKMKKKRKNSLGRQVGD